MEKVTIGGTMYVLHAVNNGWVLNVSPCDLHKAAPFGDFIFLTLREVMDWLAVRHGEHL
ncbi:hypothetical protein PQQ99_07790 [Paraburkholderia sediminicola]|uniref:Uncharacterized protein n=1 Tax=Paraburkholderia metrosideri TaxID=580937 RepID=A0ABW9DVN9_9BURK